MSVLCTIITTVPLKIRWTNWALLLAYTSYMYDHLLFLPSKYAVFPLSISAIVYVRKPWRDIFTYYLSLTEALEGHFYLLLITYYLLLITYHLLVITYYLLLITYYLLLITYHIKERSGSLVECLTRDRGAAGLSLTGVTTLCPWARTLILA